MTDQGNNKIGQYVLSTNVFTEFGAFAANAGLETIIVPSLDPANVYGTELNQRRHELLVSIAGPQALGWQGPGFAAEELSLTRDWLRSRGNSIEGGTSEIQLNIIAKRVLGLPD